MSDLPRPHVPPEPVPRRGAAPPDLDQPPHTAAAEHRPAGSEAPPAPPDERADDVGETLSSWAAPQPAARAGRPRRGRGLRHPDEQPARPLTAEQRLLLLDTWLRSGLPAGDFAALVGMSKHTLYDWKRKF